MRGGGERALGAPRRANQLSGGSDFVLIPVRLFAGLFPEAPPNTKEERFLSNPQSSQSVLVLE